MVRRITLEDWVPKSNVNTIDIIYLSFCIRLFKETSCVNLIFSFVRPLVGVFQTAARSDFLKLATDYVCVSP